MKDQSRTKAQLAAEVKRLRRRVAELESTAESGQTEIALQESEKIFRELVERARDGIVIIHQDRVAYVNPAFCRLIGFASEELVGGRFGNIFDPGQRDLVVDRYRRRMAGEDVPSLYETRMVHKDGRVIDVEFNAGLINYEGETANLTIIRDITDRKQAQQALKESEEQFRGLIEHARDGIVIVHRDRVAYVNPAYSRLTGYAYQKVVGTKFSNIFDPRQRDMIVDRHRRRMAGEDVPSIYEARLVHKDGRVIDVEFNAGMINYRGEIANLTIVRDIAERKQAQQALEESEARFRDLAELLPESIYEMDATGRLTFANRTAFAQFGYTPRDLEEGLNGFDMIVPEQRTKARQRGQRSMDGEDLGLTEYAALTKDGRVFPALFRSTPIFHEGRPVGLRGFIIDITERKRVEEALGQSEAHYRAVVEHTGTAVSVTAADGSMVMVNSKFEELSGYDREELEGKKSWTEFVAQEDLPRLIEYRRNRDQGKPSPEQYEFVFIDRHGNRRHVVNTATRIPGTDRTVSSIMDITERKEAEAALQETQEKYYSILAASPDPIVFYDHEGRVIYVNPSFTRVFGWTFEEVAGKGVDFVPEEDWPETLRNIERSQRGESYYGFETRRYTKDGRLLDIRVNVAVWRDPQGTPAGSVVTLRDVTERKRMEVQFQHARKMEAIGTLAGGVAHDFNNALQAISGYVQLMLLRKQADDPDQEYLEAMDKAIQRTGGLINQLLTVSRKVESRPEPVDLGRVVVETGRLLERTIPRMIRIEIDNAEDLYPVNADPTQLEQIILNLGGNARDAMPEGGRLQFTTRNLDLTEDQDLPHAEIKPGRYVVLEVADTGHGMDEETAGHIFEPFFTTKGPGHGTGLGLATVYGIVQNHGGHIACNSRVGRGTTFTIHLPALDDPGPAAQAGPVEEDTVRGGAETVLLVDDERPILDIAGEVLGQYGYSILTATSGEEALEVYLQNGHGIDLVILDLSMPGMGGHKCLRELLAFDPQARVIIASGYSSESPSGAAAEPGAKGFIGKPYSLIGLLKLVREVLDDLG
jgi:PAS domain S-box-containing protein